MPELNRFLLAVANLPLALPATKTNVGVYVDSQFTMPVHISAQPLLLMSLKDMIILGIDPGTNIMGFGLIRVNNQAMELIQL